MVQNSSAQTEWKNHWTLVLAAFLGFSLSSVMTASLSLFMQPVGREFGWGRTLLSIGFTIAAVVGALLSPFFGAVIDRYGSRRVAIPGIIATSLAIACFYFTNASPLSWFALWALYAVIAISVKPTVWTAAVAGTFTAAQGLALGVTLCGGAAAQVIVPALTYGLIQSFGWRLAYVFLGLGWGGVTLLFAWLFLFDAHDRKAGLTLAPERGDLAAGASPIFSGLTVGQAWRDAALWRIAASTLIVMLLSTGLSIHQIAILGEAGVARHEAALLASLSGVAAIAGMLGTGFLLDRFRPNWIGGLTLVFSALAFGLLIGGIRSPALIVVAMLVNGYTQGTKVQIVSCLTARYAGMRNYGKIFGVMHSIMAFSSGAGPLVAGLIYDASGGYTGFLVAGTIGSVLAGILLFTLPSYPVLEAAAPANAPLPPG